jgi:hypothetical protein
MTGALAHSSNMAEKKIAEHSIRAAHTARYSRFSLGIFHAISGLAGIFIYREVLQNTADLRGDISSLRPISPGSRLGADLQSSPFWDLKAELKSACSGQT